MKNILLIVLMAFACLDAAGQFRRQRDISNAVGDDLNYASPPEYTIAGIDVTGLTLLDKNALISLSGLRLGDKIKIPGEAISGAIRTLWKHQLAGDVQIAVDRIDGDNVYLNIIMSERPRLNSFYFTGINKSEESTLKEDLKLFRGRVISDAMIRNTELTVKKHFVSKGFLNTEVKVVQEADTVNKDGIKLRIMVDPKNKVNIHSINFTGNTDFTDDELKKKFKKTHEHPRFTLHRALLSGIINRPIESLTESHPVTWDETMAFLHRNVKLNLFKGSKFIKADYEEDKKKLITYLNSKGYRDANILSDTIVAYGDNSIDINFELEQGAKYYIRNITWSGNYVYTDEALDDIVGVKKGEIYNKELIMARMNGNRSGVDLAGLYWDNGYLFYENVPVETVVGKDSIDIEFRITEGEQATINEVTISGNDRTNDHVIRRELLTIPGEKFSRSALIITQQRLSYLQYFDAEKINPDLKPNPELGIVDVDWQLVEQSSDKIELSGGWGGYYGFVGTVGLTFNNFSAKNIVHPRNWRRLPVGDGQKFSVSVQANGQSFQNYAVSFQEPWLGGNKPVALTISANKAISRYAGVGASSYYDLNSHLKLDNITVALGHRLKWDINNFTLSNSVSYSVYTLKNIDYGLGCTNCTSHSITFNTTLARNSMDSPEYPSSGSQVQLSVTATPPYSAWQNLEVDSPEAKRYKWIEYHKWMFDSKFYQSMDRKNKLVLEATAHFGFIGSYSKKLGIGPFERFYLGGDGLAGGFGSFVLGQDVIGLRGYENNQITPPYNSTNPIKGGVVYDKFGFELRYPLVKKSGTNIYGFGFAEAGNNWYNYEDFNPFELYKSVGFGVRLNMPMFGLIGISWGYGLDPFPLGSENPVSGGHFHFSLGQQLR